MGYRCRRSCSSATRWWTTSQRTRSFLGVKVNRRPQMVTTIASSSGMCPTSALNCSPNISSTPISLASFASSISMKVDTDRWEFANDKFVRGQKHLLASIVRRKNSQNVVPKITTQQEVTKSSTTEDDKRLALWKEVESLKIDKNALMQELIKLRQHQQTSQSRLLLLREQVKGMEKNQQQMLSFIVMAMQNPGFLLQFLQPKEYNWLMAETGSNVLSKVDDKCELAPSNGMMVKYQPPLQHQVAEPICSDPTSDPEKSMEHDFSSNDIEENEETGRNNASSEEVEHNSELTPSNGILVKYQSPTHQVAVPKCIEPTSYAEKSTDLDFSLDDIKDLFKNIDIFPGPFDEGFLPSENSDPFSIPDMLDGDDVMDMLLSSPISEREELEDGIGEGGTTETPPHTTHAGNFEGMDTLTEQMGHTKF
ncbi:PREDICTED: heat stress transcription factor A-1-like isoform X2 [Ipomoea nil]|uniref:heat stress transcription factor A-1-like isoform X2 n=1 Tax=Ipomoea nil TaxID=35883 RepID=UPI000901F463|nr:PREDICTED: heat stress transcription factor A-1-like isoform X2 [Ipomoea nil]